MTGVTGPWSRPSSGLQTGDNPPLVALAGQLDAIQVVVDLPALLAVHHVEHVVAEVDVDVGPIPLMSGGIVFLVVIQVN